MSYEALAEKIKTLPTQYLDEVSDFVEYLALKAKQEQPKTDDVTKKINALYSSLKKENWQSVMDTGLESARKILKNDSW